MKCRTPGFRNESPTDSEVAHLFEIGKQFGAGAFLMIEPMERTSVRCSLAGPPFLQDDLLQAIQGLLPAVPAIEAVRIAVAAASSLCMDGVPYPASTSRSSTRTPTCNSATYPNRLDDRTGRKLVEIVHAGFDQLRAVAAGE